MYTFLQVFRKTLIKEWNGYIYQPGGKIYTFLSFNTPKSCILKQR